MNVSVNVPKKLPSVALGQSQSASGDNAGRLVVSPSKYLSALLNTLFVLDSQSVTLASANATKSALGTAKFINGFYNGSSGATAVNAVIRRVHVATVSGTPAGPYFYNYLNLPSVNQPATSASTGTIQAGFLSSAATASVVTPLVNVVLAATGAPTTALNQLGLVGGPAAIAAGAGLYDAFDEPDGGIVVPPGCLFGIMATAAGTTHVVQSTLVWEEILVTASLGNP